MAVSIALVWLATALSVVHPYFRQLGAHYLELAGFPLNAMYLACFMELALGIWVLLGKAGRVQTAIQVGAILGFTLILGMADPSLLIHPLGVLTKNISLLSIIIVAYWIGKTGWTPVSILVLRVGMAVIWFTEGFFPKLLFQQQWELEMMASFGLGEHAAMWLSLLGILQVASAFAVLLLKGWPRKMVLSAQLVVLLILCLMVSIYEPLWWVHPFGPLSKLAPIAVGLWLLRGMDRVGPVAEQAVTS